MRLPLQLGAGWFPDHGSWLGRCYVPAAMAWQGVAGPHVVWVKGREVFDLSAQFDTISQVLQLRDPARDLEKPGQWRSLGLIDEMLQHALYYRRSPDQPHLLAPCDIQAIKACGVTFIQSLLERVIEEKAMGDASQAAHIREVITEKIGASLKDVKPGSEQALLLKQELRQMGVWSQYLEVGIGKDAEIFTKCQPMSAVGFGSQIGVLRSSGWNNPEPEVVLAVNQRGEICGATLGNDVNLRDYEGRSALLLGEAKDQNGSCAIGPLIRLFDRDFTLEQVNRQVVHLEIRGTDGFRLEAVSEMDKISRSPRDLVNQACGASHQYPDGFFLFCGTMFAPTTDREAEGMGFTHHVGDRVTIASPALGQLVNWVDYCDAIPPWEFGLEQLMQYVLERRRKG